MEKKKRSRFLFKWLLCLLIFILLIVTSNIWLPLPGTFLAGIDNIARADCIVPLGGDLYFRYKKAVELYNQGYAKKIVVSLEPKRVGLWDYDVFLLRLYKVEEVSSKELALMVFRYFGKDASNIYFTDYEVTSTYEEAKISKDFMLKNGFKSLILITTTYHTRRALMIFESVFRGSGIKIYNCVVGKELYNPSHWWQKEIDVRMVADEYLSMVFNFIYHFLLKKERTSFDN